MLEHFDLLIFLCSFPGCGMMVMLNVFIKKLSINLKKVTQHRLVRMLELVPTEPEILKYIKAELNRFDRIIIDMANNADLLT